MQTLAYLLPALTLALRRAEAAYRRQQATWEAGRSTTSEQDMWTVQVLVVVPSQELAMQICRVAKDLMPPEGKGAVQQAIGGANMRRQAEAIQEKQPLFVVGTPGRLVALIRMGVLHLHRCSILILDEADQLLGDIFAPDMAHINLHCGKRLAPNVTGAIATGAKGSSAGGRGKRRNNNSSSDGSVADAAGNGTAAAATDVGIIPTKRQTVLVSATLWAGGLERFAAWCPDPMFITMGGAPTWSDEGSTVDVNGALLDTKQWGWGAKGWDGPASAVQQGPKTQALAGGAESGGLVPTMPPNLEHLYLVINPQHRADALRRAMYALDVRFGLGFMNWQQRLKDVAAKLASKKIEVGHLHGELVPVERAAVLDSARKGEYRVLLVSDVAARGLDLPQVDVVFNIELPSNAAHYAHRAGRTGRMGAPGLVLTLVSPGERFVVERLSKRLGVPILECHVTGGQLVIGPPPARDSKKKPRKREQQQEQSAAGQQAAANADRRTSNSRASTNSSSSSSRSQSVYGADAASNATSTSDMADNNSANNDKADNDYIVDDNDDIEVDEDEPLDSYKQRLKREVQAELEDLHREKQALRQQQYAVKKQQAATGGCNSDSRSSSRSNSGRRLTRPAPKGTPAQAAAMAIAAMDADRKGRKSKLPHALLPEPEK
eukprot:GHRR01015861.1.p1 GENE.GHRR01015861.1~~GHRR01015861.1.p1  ORF type:complete len:662 (+),score=244.46 GHRR01015861.1:415-2400(+)